MCTAKNPGQTGLQWFVPRDWIKHVQLKYWGHEKKEHTPIKEEPYFDGQVGINAFEPNVDIKVEPDAEHEEKYDTR